MGRTPPRLYMSMSVDGYIVGPDDRPDAQTCQASLFERLAQHRILRNHLLWSMHSAPPFEAPESVVGASETWPGSQHQCEEGDHDAGDRGW